VKATSARVSPRHAIAAPTKGSPEAARPSLSSFDNSRTPGFEEPVRFGVLDMLNGGRREVAIGEAFSRISFAARRAVEALALAIRIRPSRGRARWKPSKMESRDLLGVAFNIGVVDAQGHGPSCGAYNQLKIKVLALPCGGTPVGDGRENALLAWNFWITYGEEPWLRGPIDAVDPLTAPVLYASTRLGRTRAAYRRMVGEQLVGGSGWGSHIRHIRGARSG